MGKIVAYKKVYKMKINNKKAQSIKDTFKHIKKILFRKILYKKLIKKIYNT